MGRKKKRRLAFLDILLESYDAGDISGEGVREEVDTFMFEVCTSFVWGAMFGRSGEITR